MIDIAQIILEEKDDPHQRLAIEQAISEKSFNRLAQLVGLKVIHISERDTQVSNRLKEADELGSAMLE